MGIAVHCNDDPFELATRHSSLPKAKIPREGGTRILGICLRPQDGAIRFGVSLQFAWKADKDLEP